MARRLIYYYTKITFKGIVKRDMTLLEKKTRKQKGIAFTLRTRHKPCVTGILQKAAQKLKIKSVGIFFSERCIYGCMGQSAKDIYKRFPERHKNYFKNHQGGL